MDRSDGGDGGGKAIEVPLAGKTVPASWLAALSVLTAASFVALGVLAAGSSSDAPIGANAPATSSAGSSKMIEYVAGHWVSFESAKPLSSQQWAVVDAYANFSSAAVAVYATRSVAPLSTVVSAESKVTAMFNRDLAAGKDPEALYTKAVVESVAISGCRAKLVLELYYPHGRTLHYVSSWVRPYDRAGLPHHRAIAPTGHILTLAGSTSKQYAPWQFVGDNRVGGVDAPCGI
ncbi:MAG: hypothetical protein M1115_04775 [Actinobacteria bacterium]|nr:hypothetical protein [Actinomycetota bacterium]